MKPLLFSALCLGVGLMSAPFAKVTQSSEFPGIFAGDDKGKKGGKDGKDGKGGKGEEDEEDVAAPILEFSARWG